jgi:hypothetical protein
VASTEKAATFRDVFRDAEFRVVWAADLLSVAGDQVTRVALIPDIPCRRSTRCWSWSS